MRSMSEPFTLPEGFRFGVATAGFQIEGGYNGPGEPRNNWFDWEAAGRVEPSGDALRFWDQYEHHLDRAVAAGCDAFRISVEWARCEPREGDLDTTALDRYAAILDACHERGLEPLVTLHHFTHPHWLGPDLWLDADSPERYAGWVRAAVSRLRERCRQWVTINEINIIALQTYVTGDFPPGRRMKANEATRAIDHLLAAHVLGYAEIKALQPDSVVATNNYSFSIYELDRLAIDVLLARHHDVARDELGPWLLARRDTHDLATPATAGKEAILRRWARAAIPLEHALPRAVSAVFDSPHRCTLDVTQVDFYNPLVSSHVRLPGHRTAGGRSWMPARMLWDDPPDPTGFARYVRMNVEPGLPVWVVENGLCNRVRQGRSYPRTDGWDRVRYLREHLAEVVRLVDAGVAIGAYFHWCLADNYEWGSYEPRFGLYGVVPARGLRWTDSDAMGGDAAGTFRRIAEGLRAGDRSVLG